MPDHVDPVNDLLEFTQRCCSLFTKWFYLLLRRPATLVHPLSTSYFEDSEGGHHSRCSSLMSTIHISSDDSILDSDHGDSEVVSPLPPALASSGEVVSSSAPSAFASSSGRILPGWAHPAGSGYGVKSANQVSSQERSSTNFRPPHGTPSYPSYGMDNHASSSHKPMNGHFRYSNVNGSYGWEARYDGSTSFIPSSSPNLSRKKYEEHMTGLTEKRVLPPSFQFSGHASPPFQFPLPCSDNNPSYNDGSSFQHIQKSQDSTGLGGSSRKDNDDEEVVVLGSTARVLPPTLLHPTPALPSHYSTPLDPLLRAGIGERATQHDEKLIYEAVLQDISRPRHEIDLPDGLLSVPLLRHQKITLAWMLQKETKSVHCLGGILVDDQV